LLSTSASLGLAAAAIASAVWLAAARKKLPLPAELR
jgi:hypothetical protein